MDMRAMQAICPIGIDVHMQSTELHGQQGYYRYDDKQCGARAHCRIIHEALWITNFVTGRLHYRDAMRQLHMAYPDDEYRTNKWGVLSRFPSDDQWLKWEST